MARNYARTLVMFKPAPGKQSLELVPDLATDLGKSSDGGKTWTYTIQKGLKYRGRHADHQPRTSPTRVSRTFDRAELKLGPAYFADQLDWPKGYKGPFKGPKNADISSAIETPDDSTIVFHLKTALRRVRLPRRAARRPHRCRPPRTPARSTRPTRSPRVPTCGRATPTSTAAAPWSATPTGTPKTDPNRKALPDQIDVKLGLQADDLDNQIIAGDQDVDIAGTGVQPAALPKVLQQKALQARADNPIGARSSGSRRSSAPSSRSTTSTAARR